MGSSPITRFRSPVAQLGERLFYTQDVAGSIPVRTTNLWVCSLNGKAPVLQTGRCRFNSDQYPLVVSEAKEVAALVCGTSNSGFKPRQTPFKEDTAHGRATGLENQSRAFWVVGIAAVQLAFNQHQRGSTPLPPINSHPS